MSKVVIIVNEDGSFDTVLGDTEVEVVLFKRGQDDRQIDAAETELPEYELT